MSKHRLVLAVVTVALVLVEAGVAQADTYDISNDFAVVSNPNGVWTYGFSTTLGGPLTTYDAGFTNGSGLQV